MICGGGDSAIVEILHYLLKDFTHDQISGLVELPSMMSLANQQANERTLAQDFENAELQWDLALPPAPTKPLAWYLSVKSTSLLNPGFEAKYLESGGAGSVAYLTIEAFLRDQGIHFDDAVPYAALEGEDPLATICQQIASFDDEALADLEARLDPILAKDASEVIGETSRLFARHAFKVEGLQSELREDFEIVWNVPNHRPYWRGISGVNRIVAGLIDVSEAVIKETRPITAIEKTEGGWRVLYEDGGEAMFDRVALRLGPQLGAFENDLSRAPTDIDIDADQVAWTMLARHRDAREGEVYLHNIAEETRAAAQRLNLGPCADNFDLKLRSGEDWGLKANILAGATLRWPAGGDLDRLHEFWRNDGSCDLQAFWQAQVEVKKPDTQDD